MVVVENEIQTAEPEETPEASSDHSSMDIRFFIGLLLTIYGVILVIYGFLKPEYASMSLGFNLNLIWGFVLLVIGLAFYIPSDKPDKWAK